LDYVTDFCTQQRPEGHCPLLKNHKGFKKQDKTGYPIQENTKPKQEKCMRIYTTHDTMLMNTDSTRISTTYLSYFIVLYHYISILFYRIISHFIFLLQTSDDTCQV